MMPSIPWTSSRNLESEFRPDGKHVLQFDTEFPLRMFRFEFSWDHRISPNYHDYLEINYLSSGKGELIVGTKKYRLAPGDLFIVGNDEMHSFFAEAQWRPRLLSVFFMPRIVCQPGSPAILSELLRPFYDRSAGFSHVIRASSAIGRPVFQRMNGLHAVLAKADRFKELASFNILCEMLLHIRRWYDRLDLSSGAGATIRRGHSLDRMKDVFAYLNRHYNENISLSQLASIACFSPAYFCSSFRTVTGLTPKEYLTRLRIDKAKEMLAGRSLTMTAIALEVGFESLAYFDRVFRKYARFSPQEYRRRIENTGD
jgi:AraC-like DNA-binding protein/quercetin dioxygenase-like cupin family protein